MRHFAPFVITVAAVQSFQKLFVLNFARNAAFREFVLLAEPSHPMRERTRRGDELWSTPLDAAVRFVVKRDRRLNQLFCVAVWRLA